MHNITELNWSRYSIDASIPIQGFAKRKTLPHEFRRRKVEKGTGGSYARAGPAMLCGEGRGLRVEG